MKFETSIVMEICYTKEENLRADSICQIYFIAIEIYIILQFYEPFWIKLSNGTCDKFYHESKLKGIQVAHLD